MKVVINNEEFYYDDVRINEAEMFNIMANEQNKAVYRAFNLRLMKAFKKQYTPLVLTDPFFLNINFQRDIGIIGNSDEIDYLFQSDFETPISSEIMQMEDIILSIYKLFGKSGVDELRRMQLGNIIFEKFDTGQAFFNKDGICIFNVNTNTRPLDISLKERFIDAIRSDSPLSKIDSLEIKMALFKRPRLVYKEINKKLLLINNDELDKLINSIITRAQNAPDGDNTIDIQADNIMVSGIFNDIKREILESHGIEVMA